MSDSTKGCTIIDRVQIGTEKDDTELVLVDRGPDVHSRYVIWKRFKATMENGRGAYTYSGHYFSKFLSAVVKWMDMTPTKEMIVEWVDENGKHHVDVDGIIS